MECIGYLASSYVFMDYILGIIWNEVDLDCFELALCRGAGPGVA